MGLCLGKENKQNKQTITFEIEMEKSSTTKILDPKMLGENINHFSCTTISSSKKETGVDNFYILMNNSGLSHIVDCIFWYLDDKSQLKCRLVCHSWKVYIGWVPCSDYFFD